MSLSEGVHLYPEFAVAGLWSTATALASVAQSMQRAAAGCGEEFLAVDVSRQMLEPRSGLLGLGPALGGVGSRKAFGHNGANAGFRRWLRAHVVGPVLVMMTNADNGQVIAEPLCWAGEREGLCERDRTFRTF